MQVVCWLLLSYPRICYYFCKKSLNGMDKQTFLSELAKYTSLFHAHSKGYGARELQMQLYAFTYHTLSIISDNLEMSDDPYEPTLLTVVRDDLERMKLFFLHYRKLGVKQFVVIDNGSTDGTLEWISQQQNTRCYRVSVKFLTASKIGWIEKVLALTGYNRWYVVVDSDELLDYVGSEHNNLKSLILHAIDNGYKHMNGYMLDMYSGKPLFAEECRNNEIVSRLRYFDESSYTLNHNYSPIIDKMVVSLFGGPRSRVFKNTGPCLNKQSMFYYDSETLYCSPHYFWPYNRWDEMSCSYVLRHYKFLKHDLCEFKKRIEEKGFWNGSKEYQNYLQTYYANSGICMKSKESKEYISSASLSTLPFLEILTNGSELR